MSSQENLVVSDAPGHTPWGDIEDSLPTAWIPEGSIYPPEAFREAVSKARRTRQVKSCWEAYRTPAGSAPTPSPASARRASCHPTSFRKALVFEREITLNSDGKTKRWSLQVPATTMNPEMVDMMLELQDLNSFFKDGLEDLDHSVAALGKEKDRFNLPSLVVSNSDFALPISLESSGNLTPGVPLALATRRGKKMLPPLSFQQEFDEIPYPSMPTAFLGSPSTYSPKFEFANRSGEPSMDPENMIASLRSQYTSILRSSHVAEIFEEKQVVKPLNPPNFHFVEDIHDNEWSFANGLMDKYGGSPLATELVKKAPANPVHHSVIQNAFQLDTPADFEAESFADSPASTPDSSAESIDAKIADVARLYPPQPTSRNWRPPLTSRPPSTPLPPCPSPTGPSSPRREVRGILKSCKSVRFASLPSRHEAPPIVAEPRVRVPRHSTGTPSIVPLRRPSPLRNTYTPKINTVLLSATAVAPNFPPRRSVAPANTAISRSAGKQRRSTFGGSNRPVSTPALASSPSPIKEILNQAFIRSPLRRSTARHSELSTQRSGLHTSSLGRCSLGYLNTGKENKNHASLTPITSSRYSIVNENKSRRGSNDSQMDSGLKKSRMPIPLRNMFMRFK